MNKEVSISELYQGITNIENITEKVDKLNHLAYITRYSNPADSVKFANEARAVAEQEKYKTGIAVAWMHLAFANFLMSSDFPVLKHLVDAHSVLTEVNKIPELPIVLNYLGNVYDSYGEYQKGIEFCHKALTLTKENTLKEVEADTLSTLGIIYSRICDFESSTKYHLQSYELRCELDNKPAMASSLNLIARSYTLSHENEKAEEFYQKAIELRKAIGDQGALPWSYLGVASLYEKQKRYPEAIEYYNKSIELNKINNDRRCNLQCNLGLGKIFIEIKDQVKALDCLNNSLVTARELNAKPILIEIYKALSDYYERAGNITDAYNYYKQYHALKEDVLNTELHNKLKNQQISFEVDKVQKEAEIYQLRNVELKKAFDEIAMKNTMILDSINYARNIQSALLPPENLLQTILPEHFILNLPRDIVAGDFLFAHKSDNKLYVAVVDCTGHGVPGAFMSMLGYSFINEIVQSNPDLMPGEVLDKLRQKIISALRQSNENENTSRDGMDLSFCTIDYNLGKIYYAGAFNSAYYIKNGVLEELKANRMPIGVSYMLDTPFTTQEMDLEKGMCIYMFSDGYSDQFGGTAARKYMSGNFKKLLATIAHLPLNEQRSILEKSNIEWRGNLEQTDDIMVFGLRL